MENSLAVLLTQFMLTKYYKLQKHQRLSFLDKTTDVLMSSHQRPEDRTKLPKVGLILRRAFNRLRANTGIDYHLLAFWLLTAKFHLLFSGGKPQVSCVTFFDSTSHKKNAHRHKLNKYNQKISLQLLFKLMKYVQLP